LPGKKWFARIDLLHPVKTALSVILNQLITRCVHCNGLIPKIEKFESNTI